MTADWSQLELFGAGRWQKALFTTYALSLTWFETYVLPRLRQAGCEEVTVLTDLEGYRASMMERRARYVGQEYALIPVSSSQGIFHPKLTYLQGADEHPDMVLVSSGNLTSGGYGRNLEVMEALDSRTEGLAFTDLADFLAALADRKDLVFGTAPPLEAFARRAHVMSRGAPEGTTRLLHSLRQSIEAQLIELAGGHPWEELFVLSPFHSAAANPIQGLAQALEVRNLRVAVSKGSHQCSSFPFEQATRWGLEVTPVALAEEESRQFHAKWLELRGDEVWTFTGSVNATHQSMGSTKNVEVGVLRRQAASSAALWKPAKRPTYVADKMEFSPEARAPGVFAEITDDATLSGQLLGASALDGRWRIRVETDPTNPLTGDIDVDADGRFKWRHGGLSLFAVKSGVQLCMSRGDQEARGWVSIGGILRLAPATRRALGAIKRLMERAESTEDLELLFGYLTTHVSRVVAIEKAQGLPTTTTADGAGVSVDWVPPSANIDDLVAASAGAEARLYHDLAAASTGEGHSWRVLEVLTRMLLGAAQAASGGCGAQPGRIDSPEDEDDAREQQEQVWRWQAAMASIEDFDQRVRAALQDDDMPSNQRCTILRVWGAALLDLYLLRRQNVREARSFLTAWLREATRLRAGPSGREPLDEGVYGAAAVVATYPDQLPHGVTLHEMLERYAGGAVNPTRVLACAERWLSYPTYALLLEGAPVSMPLDAMSQELARPTRRQALAAFVHARQQGEASTLPADLFNPVEIALLSERIKRTGRGRISGYFLVDKAARGCPACHHFRLNEADQRELATRRWTVCRNFNHLLLALEP